jgi:hypothetical protein
MVTKEMIQRRTELTEANSPKKEPKDSLFVRIVQKFSSSTITRKTSEQEVKKYVSQFNVPFK